MAFAFDEYPIPELPGAYIFDDFENESSTGFDLPAPDDLPGCSQLDTPSPNIFEGLSLTPSGSSAYGFGEWETLTPEEVLESQVNVVSKTHVQDTAFEALEGSSYTAAAIPGDPFAGELPLAGASKSLGPPENNTLIGTESTWDLSMNPVKSRNKRPKTKKQRAAASFVRKYGACSVHKKAKKSCACNLPAMLRPLDATPQTADIESPNMGFTNLTPESMTPSSPNGASEQRTPEAADPQSHSHPPHLRKALLIQRVLSMLLLALNTLPIDEHTNPSQPDTDPVLSLIQQSAATIDFPPGTVSHLESLARSALTHSLVYFCPYVFTGCSFSTGDLDAFSQHTTNHPLELVLGWDLFSLPSHYLAQSSSISSEIRRQGDAAVLYGGVNYNMDYYEQALCTDQMESLEPEPEPAQSPLTSETSPFSVHDVPPSIAPYDTDQQHTNPDNSQLTEDLPYDPLPLLSTPLIWDTATSFTTLIWDTMTSFAIVFPFTIIFSSFGYRLLIKLSILIVRLAARLQFDVQD